MNVFTAKALGLTINLTSTGGYTFNPEVRGRMIDFLPEHANPVCIYLMDTEKQAEAFYDGLRTAGVDPACCCISPAPGPFKGLYAVIREIEDDEEYTYDLINGNGFEDGDIPVIDMTSRNWVIYSPNEAAAGCGDGGFWSNEDGWVDEESATVFSNLETRFVNLPGSTGGDAIWVNLEDRKRSMMARTKTADGSRELTIEVTVKAPSDVPDSMAAHLVSMLLDTGMADAVATAEDADNCGDAAAKFAEEAVKLEIGSCRPKEAKTTEMIGYWDGIHYHEGGDRDTEGLAFECEIRDMRRESGQVTVDIAPESGSPDDGLYTTFEINRLGGSKDECPCLHVAFDHDNMALSMFKQGDKFILRPETGVEIRSTVLPDGEAAFIVE